ncbi:MMPL family transporter [Thermococcus atlanticus]
MLMSWNEWIARHAKLVVVLWVVVIILATPLAVKLSSVTNYSMEQFMPKHVESIEVQNNMSKYFSSFSQNDNMTYILLTDIKVNSPEARKAYEQFKTEAKAYGSNFTSYYDAMDMLQNESYSIALNLTKMTANLTGIFYSAAINASNAYRMTFLQIENLSKQVKTLNETLPEIAGAYLALEANLSVLYNQSLALRRALNETDLAYVELHKNLTGASEQLKALNSTIAGLNAGLYNLSDNYAKTYLGAIGAYGALVQAGAYEGGIDGVTAQTIATQLGVPIELIYAVYNATYPAYSAYGSTAITDAFLANVTKEMILGQVGEPMDKQLAEAYSIAFYQGVVAFDGKTGSDYALINLGKNAAKPVGEIAYDALNNLPSIMENAGRSFEVPGVGRIPARSLAYIVNVSVSLGRNPSVLAVENATIQVANVLMAGSPLMETPNADEIFEVLLHAPTRELEVTLLANALKERLPAGQKALAEQISKTVVSFDPNATGVLAKNPKTLKKATVSLLAGLIRERGIELPESVISQVYDSNRNVEPIARELLIQKTAGEIGSEKVAETVVSIVLKNPEELAKGIGVKDAIKGIITNLTGTAPIDLGKVVEGLYAGKSSKEIAYSLFEEGVNEKLANVTAPEDVKEALRGIILTVAGDYPMSDSEIETLVKEKTAKLVEKFVKEINLGVPIRVNTTQLVEVAFKFRDDPGRITGGNVRPIEEQVYPSIYSLAKSYISMLKSPDNTTMLIMMIPRSLRNVTDLEKQAKFQYENTLKAKEVLLKEMRRYFPEAKAHISGTPVQTYEMIHYGKEDNVKTTRFSVIGALIVLLVILGVALLATLLPFTGVATATLTALGILYLLARGNIVSVGSWAQMITITTALGLGIDYSTYYLHRFKEYLAEGYEHEKAVSEALKRAKDAVLASASTDIIAFASFILAWEFPIFRQMGVIAPVAVIVVLIASLTFIPAITALIGNRRIFWWPRHIKHIEGMDVHKKSRIAAWSVKHAKAVLLISLIVLTPAVYSFAHFNGTHDIKLFIPKDSETYGFLKLSEEKLGVDVMGSTYVLIEFNHRLGSGDLGKINGLVRDIEGIKGVKYVYTVTQPYGKPINTDNLKALKSIGGDRYVSSDGRMVLIQVVSEYRATTPQAHRMVRDIRNLLRSYEKNGKIVKGMVGGGAALDLDLSNLINNIFWHRIFPVALVLMFLSLLPTLRGLPAVVSTMSTIGIGVMLSIWLSNWLFQKVFGEPIMWFLPLMVFIVLMGVGIDYNSFYLVKARDEFERRDAKEALTVAAGSMDLVVIGLAAVLATTYGALITSSTWGTREIGFALAAGVLITATLAVYFLGPAMMSLFGEKAWWPLHRKND